MKNLFLTIALLAFLFGSAQEKTGRTKTENSQRIKSNVSSNRTKKPIKGIRAWSDGKKEKKEPK